MVFIIIGIIFLVAALVFFKIIGGKEGIVMMTVCGVLGVFLLVYGFITINNNNSNDKDTEMISISENYNYSVFKL